MIISKKDALNSGIWTEGFLAYNQSHIAINSVPKESLKELEDFFYVFTKFKDILSSCLYLFSFHVLTAQNTVILKSDIVDLPWPNDKNFNLVKWEEEMLDDVREYIAEYVRVGQKSKLLQNDASDSDLDSYTQTFLRLIRKYFNKAERSHSQTSNGLILMAFTFSGQKELAWLEPQPDPKGENSSLDNSDWGKNIRNLIDRKHSAVLRTKRIVRILTGNSFIIIKPSKLRYWIRSTAIRDVDDVVADILNGEAK
jgi:hypothetical protein